MSRSIGLVGTGIWGGRMLSILRELGCRVHVADVSPSAREGAAALGAASTCEAVEELPGVHGYVVATPASTHASVLRRLNEFAGPLTPILCEKPFTTSLADAIELAALLGPRLFVDHTWRYHPGIVSLGNLARSGQMGKVHGVRTTRVNWSSPRSDVDTIWNLVPHDITLAIEILGGIPVPRAAHSEILGGRSVGLWGFLGGDPWLVLESSNRFADKRREVRLHGERGVAVLPDIDSSCIEITWNSPGSKPEAPERVPIQQANPLRLLLDDFVTRVRIGEGGPKSGAAEAVEVVRAVVALRALAGLAD